MDNTKYLLIFACGIGAELIRLAAIINEGKFLEGDMQYYAENDNLKKHLKLEDHLHIVRVEEINGVIGLN